MDKIELIQKIKQLEGISQDERVYLIDLVNTKKKYGLVWEDKPEDVEEQLRENLPVLKEVKEKAIVNGDEHPNHILIEGDNLHALTSLVFTHEGRIDGMYFDPPYNTGAKDWRYNNDYVDKEDSFKHSKWISFMDKRLRIAHKLLSDNGIICVTIDDYEMPRLFILMESIFGEDNHLGTIVIRNNPAGRSTVKGVSITHEYALFFGKTINSKVGRLERNEKQLNRYKEEDENGFFEWVNFRKPGSMRKESPKMFYPIFANELNFRIPEMEFNAESNEYILKEEPNIDELIIYPIDDDGKERRWRWGIDRFINSPNDFKVNKLKGKLHIYVKGRMNEEGVLPMTWWDNKEYSSTAYGTNLVKDIFSELQVFSYPKSLYAVIDSIKVLSNEKDAIILDIFGGSGTTMHAVMELNKYDKGRRQAITVSNNENKICEEVTYERNKRVIEGYTNSKGIEVEGLKNNNLRYFKSEYVSREQTLKNKRELTKLATELLCIKEDCYTEVTGVYIADKKQHWIKIFATQHAQFVVIYDDAMIEDSITYIEQLNANKQNKEKVKVYVFSNGQYPYTEDFEDVLPFITLCALPDAIYKAYQNVLPKKQRKVVPVLEEEHELGENDLFS
jgi:adenine-specific DNA-methyltransferase